MKTVTWLGDGIVDNFLLRTVAILIFSPHNIHKYKDDQELSRKSYFLIFNIVLCSFFTILPMTIEISLIQMSLMSSIQMSLILAPLGQCFTLWMLLRVVFFFYLKFYHSMSWYGCFFIHHAWHMMGLLNLMSFFSPGKFSSIIALSIPSYPSFLSFLFHLLLRVDECWNFWIHILCVSYLFFLGVRLYCILRDTLV